jgi:hypothetical protein
MSPTLAEVLHGHPVDQRFDGERIAPQHEALAGALQIAQHRFGVRDAARFRHSDQTFVGL